MNALRPLACLGALCCALAPTARAASGGIDSFSASATQVQAGGMVDFSVAFSLGTTSWSGGGSWSFAVTFATPGTYSFDLSGGWQSDVHSGYSNESASRNCCRVDPDDGSNLARDAWSWSYSDGEDNYSSDGSFSGRSISIEVVAAPVPEPASWALMLAGAAWLAARARRRA